MKFRTAVFGDVVLFKGNDIESRTIIPFLEKRGDSPPNWCDEFVILEHKEITPSKRRGLRKLNKILPKNYDRLLILKLGFNSFLPQYSKLDDLSTENAYTCTSRIALMYNLLEMSIMEGVNCSQINPEHFIDGKNFEVIKEWKKTY